MQKRICGSFLSLRRAAKSVRKKVYAKIVGRSRVGRSQVGTIIRDNANIFLACWAQLKLFKTLDHSNRWRLWSHPILINPKSLGSDIGFAFSAKTFALVGNYERW